jgi:hypothetical protein
MEPSERLAGKLSVLTEAAIDRLSLILALELDVENGSLLRAQTMAAAVAINAQLRADALSLRAIRADKALDRLLEMMREKALLVPSDAKRSPDQEARPAESMLSLGGSGVGCMLD